MNAATNDHPIRTVVPTSSGTGRTAPYSTAVKAGRWVFASGQLPVDAEGAIAEDAAPDRLRPFAEDPVARQSQRIMRNLQDAVAAAGCDLRRDAVRIYQWFTSPWPTYERYAHGDDEPRTPITITPYLRTRDEFIDEPRPASTAVRVRETLNRDAVLAVEAIALEQSGGAQKVGFGVPEGEPTPLAGYMPAIRSGDWIFLAGMVASDFRGDFGSERRYGPDGSLAPEARVNPHLWYGVSVEQQTEYTLERLAAIAEASGSSLARTVKATVYVGSPDDFAGMDRVWRRWFPDNPPARVVLPYIVPGFTGTRVEIALKLLADDADLTIEPVETSDAAEPFGHEPQAVRVGHLLFLSTQLPVDRSGGVPPRFRPDPAQPYRGHTAMQMEQMLANAAAICSAAGTSIEHLCRQQTYFADFTHHAEAMDRWAREFAPDRRPAGNSLRVGGPLQATGAELLSDMIVHVPRG